jgi:hypothetical protein
MLPCGLNTFWYAATRHLDVCCMLTYAACRRMLTYAATSHSYAALRPSDTLRCAFKTKTYCYAALRHTNKRPKRHPTMRPQRHPTTTYSMRPGLHIFFLKKTFKMPQYSCTERRRVSRGSGPRNATIFGHTFFFLCRQREVYVRAT